MIDSKKKGIRGMIDGLDKSLDKTVLKKNIRCKLSAARITILFQSDSGSHRFPPKALL